MREMSIASEIAIGACLFLDRESALFNQQCNARDVNNSKLIGFRVTTGLSVSGSTFVAIVADVNDPMTLFHSRVSCLLFAVRADRDVS